MEYLTIGFVRRGFSFGGGAEAYLQRLAAGVVEKGHRARLYTAEQWPAQEWSFGQIIRVEGKSSIPFADELERMAPRSECDVLFSLERIWHCDVYRAGDGVHAAWLQRRSQFGGPLTNLGRIFNRKHSATLALEEALLSDGGARRVIANSKRVKAEIVGSYRYPQDRIDVIYNGVPIQLFQSDQTSRSRVRTELSLKEHQVAVLFAGTGWERKGLRFAIEAVEKCGEKFVLLVAGRGDKPNCNSARIRFLGIVQDMSSLYKASDIFLLPTIYDPFSNACLEALASGLPVVTTSANGFSEIIEPDVHGTVVDNPTEIEVICHALRFWAEPTKREQAALTNRELSAQYDISMNVANTLDLLTRTAQQNV